MIRLLLYVLPVAGLPLTPVASAAQRSLPEAQVLRGRLSFDGHSSLGDFTGTTTTVTGVMKGADRLDGVTGWVEARVKTLVTGNDHRDRDLNKSMESDRFPRIRFDLDRVEAAPDQGDTAAVVLHGRFTIHGVTREAAVRARVRFWPDSIGVRGETPMNLKDYRIGGLSKMLGVLKMHPDIVVHVDLVFAPSVTGRSEDAPDAKPPAHD